MRAALFVDFDNVFSGLARLGPAYADGFARNPSRWMSWLTDKVPNPPGVATDARRRILVRRCYLNPEPYKRFRIGFSRAGFEIVDCPPMTSAGKTSTDIHMVLDIVDVLQAQTRYDEFIVFSADADFTPVLRKLRREDRRTTIFAAGATSAAYDASADLILDPEAFIREGLGFEDDEPEQARSNLDSLIAQAEAIVWRSVDQADQPVPLPVLTKTLAQQLPALPESNWAGKGTFMGLLKALPLSPLRIDRDMNALLDPRRLGVKFEPSTPLSRIPMEAAQSVPAPGVQPGTASEAAVQQLISDELSGSDRPIALARLAQTARERIPGIETHWLGYGTWKRLLESIKLTGIRIVWHQQAGYALDPERHQMDFADRSPNPAAIQAGDPLTGQVAPLLEAAGLPLLSSDRYRALLDSLSEAAKIRPFALAPVTKMMRDHCVAHGVPVSREQCNTLVRTLLFNGFSPDDVNWTLDDLVAKTCGVIIAAAQREGLRVDDEDRRALLTWLTEQRGSS